MKPRTVNLFFLLLLLIVHSLNGGKQLGNGSVKEVPNNGENKAVNQRSNPSGRAKRKPNKNTGGQCGKKKRHNNKHENRHFIHWSKILFAKENLRLKFYFAYIFPFYKRKSKKRKRI